MKLLKLLKSWFINRELVGQYKKRPNYELKFLQWSNDRIRRIFADLMIIQEDYKKKKGRNWKKELKKDQLYNQYLGKMSMLLYACQELKYPLKLSGYTIKWLKKVFKAKLKEV